MPTVSIVVVNYNGSSHLPECLEALTNQNYPAAEIIVVDNKSDDDSLTLVKAHYTCVNIIESASNVGYAGAVNLALEHTQGDYVAVLNMDVVVEPDWLAPMVEFMEKNSRIGAVSPKIILYGARDRVNALGQNIHVTGLGFNRGFNQHFSMTKQAPMKVSGIHGAAFLIRRGLLRRIGGMNEANFMYHEDVDVSWLVNLTGYDMYCVPDATVYHKYDLVMNAWKLFYLERNRWALLLVVLRWRTLLFLIPMLMLTEAMMVAYCLRRGPNFLKAKARAIAWNVQNRHHLSRRRRQVQRIRRRSDRKLIASLRLNYDWAQLLHLAR